MKKKKFRLGELFCGPGGIACGAHNAHSQDGKLTIEHAWASDFDPDTCLTYAHNICGGDNSSVTLLHMGSHAIAFQMLVNMKDLTMKSLDSFIHMVLRC